jgi:hypothetical protein
MQKRSFDINNFPFKLQMDHILDITQIYGCINNFSIPGEKSGEPQKDILDDDLL